MLSRLYDQRVFAGSEDVVFSATSEKAIKARRRRGHEGARHQLTRGEDEYKSGEDASADDELGDEDDEDEEDPEEARRIAGLKFPLQSPRHIAASQRQLHRQRHRGGHASHTLASATSRLVVDTHNGHGAGSYQISERPMELVYLPTGEIRPRDECPPGLALPPSIDVRKLLAPPASPAKNDATHRRNTRKQVLDDSVVSSTAPITRQETRESTRREQQQHKRGNNREAESSDEDDRTSHRRVNVAAATKPPRNAPASDSDASSEEEPQRHRQFHSGQAKRGGDSEQKRQKAAVSQHTSTGELQREKKRVLEKMTQLLEEQGKTQALQLKLEEYEAKMKAMERKLTAVSRQEEYELETKSANDHASLRDRDERIKMMTEELRAKDDVIMKLRQHVSAGQNASRNRTDEDRVGRARHRESAMASQLEELMNRVTVFHAQVETWKTNSRDALESCDKKQDVLELLDELWSDFPPFVIKSVATTTEHTASSGNERSTGDSSTTIRFLTKKLRQKEDELRLLNVKYVELKELCARQCIREADLQNFINDHRLRGNLVIRNPIPPRNKPSESNQADQENHRRAANTQATNQHEDEESYDEDDDEEVTPVRKPRVFIDIKRAAQPAASSIEHVRLAPSPGLAQRYQQQQALQQREGRTSTTATSRVATVASASRTVATARKTQSRTTTSTIATRASTTQRRPSTTASSTRPGSVTRQGSLTAPARRPSSQLASRPWV